jgi:hypothetical protein
MYTSEFKSVLNVTFLWATILFIMAGCASGSGSGEQGGGPGGPGSGTGGGRGRNVNVRAPGTDPFALATSNPFCDAKAQTIVRPVVESLRAYVTAYEKNAPRPPTPGFTVVAHSLAAGSAIPYWLDIEPQRPNPNARKFRAIFACEYITPLTPDQAKAKGIATNERVFMGYVTGIGMFTTRQSR